MFIIIDKISNNLMQRYSLIFVINIFLERQKELMKTNSMRNKQNLLV